MSENPFTNFLCGYFDELQKKHGMNDWYVGSASMLDRKLLNQIRHFNDNDLVILPCFVGDDEVDVTLPELLLMRSTLKPGFLLRKEDVSFIFFYTANYRDQLQRFFELPLAFRRNIAEEGLWSGCQEQQQQQTVIHAMNWNQYHTIVHLLKVRKKGRLHPIIYPKN